MLVAEKYFTVSGGFYLGKDIELKEYKSDLEFIPDKLPDLNGKQDYESAQIKLQCMKNNLRLKTGTYLYFVNKSLNSI